MLEHQEFTGALERIANTLPTCWSASRSYRGLFSCLEDAATESRKKPAAGGIGSLWRIMKDEDTVRSLQFLLKVSKQMQEKCASKHA
jgi:uncharacterized protein YjgD (DUF1641 family)